MRILVTGLRLHAKVAEYAPIWLLLSLVSCSIAPSSDCDALGDLGARDTCFRERCADLGPGLWPSVAENAGRIEDPILRGTVVFSFVRVHAAVLPPEARDPLCSLLDDPVRGICRRRFNAAHLRR